MTFGDALVYLKLDHMIARADWNGMYLYIAAIPEMEDCIVMYTAQRKYQPGWIPSQADILAEDWNTVTK